MTSTPLRHHSGGSSGKRSPASSGGVSAGKKSPSTGGSSGKKSPSSRSSSTDRSDRLRSGSSDRARLSGDKSRSTSRDSEKSRSASRDSEKSRSASRDSEKSRSVSRDRSSRTETPTKGTKSRDRSKARSHSGDEKGRGKTNSADDAATPLKSDRSGKTGDSSDASYVTSPSDGGKKTPPLKPKRRQSPGMELPVPKPRSSRHDGKGERSDGKGEEPKVLPRRERTRSREETNKKPDVEERTNKQTNDHHETLNPIRTSKSKDSLLSVNSSRRSQSRESLSTSWSDSQSNSMNQSKSRDSSDSHAKSRESLDLNASRPTNGHSRSRESLNTPHKSRDCSLDLNQSQTSISSSQSSHSFFYGNKSLNESTSSYEGPVTRNHPITTLSPRHKLQHSDSSGSNSPAVKERISALIQNALSRRDSTISVSSASSSGTSHFLKNSGDDSMLSSLSGSFGGTSEDGRPGFSNGMMYDGTNGGIDPRIAAYTQQLTGAGETQNSIESKIAVSADHCKSRIQT